ncbi:Mpo1-like protein [Streptomyces sp. NPDC050504]|uniref:Mpo1-like protein n=1 Tax=Streptomyces sp. NPDC050504 TaxID=3365618 RepID=UPI0037AE4AC8
MRDFDERFETYMLGHTNETSRWMHVAGMGLALGAAALAAKRRRPKYLLAGPALFFSCAWTGHLAFERNLPVGVSDPGAAFSGDLKMIWMMATGRNKELTELVERLRAEGRTENDGKTGGNRPAGTAALVSVPAGPSAA